MYRVSEYVVPLLERNRPYVFVLMQVPSSTEKYQYIGSRSLGLASATFLVADLIGDTLL